MVHLLYSLKGDELSAYAVVHYTSTPLLSFTTVHPQLPLSFTPGL